MGINVVDLMWEELVIQVHKELTPIVAAELVAHVVLVVYVVQHTMDRLQPTGDLISKKIYGLYKNYQVIFSLTLD